MNNWQVFLDAFRRYAARGDSAWLPQPRGSAGCASVSNLLGSQGLWGSRWLWRACDLG